MEADFIRNRITQLRLEKGVILFRMKSASIDSLSLYDIIIINGLIFNVHFEDFEDLE